jgi:hypothetical protein
VHAGDIDHPVAVQVVGGRGDAESFIDDELYVGDAGNPSPAMAGTFAFGPSLRAQELPLQLQPSPDMAEMLRPPGRGSATVTVPLVGPGQSRRSALPNLLSILEQDGCYWTIILDNSVLPPPAPTQ